MGFELDEEFSMRVSFWIGVVCGFVVENLFGDEVDFFFKFLIDWVFVVINMIKGG